MPLKISPCARSAPQSIWCGLRQRRLWTVHVVVWDLYRLSEDYWAGLIRVPTSALVGDVVFLSCSLPWMDSLDFDSDLGLPWITLDYRCGNAGEWEKALRILERMRAKELPLHQRPNLRTLNSAINAWVNFLSLPKLCTKTERCHYFWAARLHTYSSMCRTLFNFVCKKWRG